MNKIDYKKFEQQLGAIDAGKDLGIDEKFIDNARQLIAEAKAAEAALADNAALVKLIKQTYANLYAMDVAPRLNDYKDRASMLSSLGEISNADHPGAALLEQIGGLETLVGDLLAWANAKEAGGYSTIEVDLFEHRAKALGVEERD